jgi:hypothetical protein
MALCTPPSLLMGRQPLRQVSLLSGHAFSTPLLLLYYCFTTALLLSGHAFSTPRRSVEGVSEVLLEYPYADVCSRRLPDEQGFVVEELSVSKVLLEYPYAHVC